MYRIRFSKLAFKDAKKLKASHLDSKAKVLLAMMKLDPFVSSPSYEKLVGNLRGFYSRRINIQHRIVYKVDEELKLISVWRMWGHYE